MPSHTIHVGNCPVCHDGLRRVRTCGLCNNELHGLIVCDECEAIWTDPESEEYTYGKPESPSCPVCQQAIWSDNSRWSTVEDVYMLGWYTYCYIERTDADEA